MVKEQIIRVKVQGVVEGLDKITNKAQKFNTKMLAMQAMSKKLGVGVDATNSLFRQTGLEMAKSGNSIKTNNKRITSANSIWDVARKRVDSWNGVMGLNFEAWQRINMQGREFQSRGGRIANTVRKMTTGMKGFKMELLGVMFFGMALFRITTSLLRTSLEWVGVMELLSIALGILFLPVAFQLLDWAITFLEWVSSLSEEQKTWIGWLVLTLSALGGLLLIIGQLGLGIGSLIKLFSGFGSIVGPIVKGMTATFTASVGVIISVVAIIASVVIGMFLAWKENFLGMRDIVAGWFGGIRSMFEGLVNIFKGVFTIIKAIFKGDMTLLMDGFKDIFSGLVVFLTGLVKVVLTQVSGIVVGILRIIVGAIQVVTNLIGQIPKLFGGTGFEADFLGKMSKPKSSEGGSNTQGGLLTGGLSNSLSLANKTGLSTLPSSTRNLQSNQDSSISISPTYNVNVSDAEKFKEMLRRNNDELVAQTRREAQIR